MFWKKQGKPEKQLDYDRENWRPVLKCSICNGERVAGFKNIRTGEFKEESFIRSDEELEAFKRRYGISEMKKESYGGEGPMARDLCRSCAGGLSL